MADCPRDIAEPRTPAADPPERDDRRGIALITALFSIVILAVVISGAVFTSTQEYRAGRNALIEQRAFSVAEYGLNSEISNWDRSRNLPGGMAVGVIDSSDIYVASGDTARVKVTRLTDNEFWVISDGEANMGSNALSARRQTGAYVRIAYPTINPKGAITAAGNVKVQGSAQVDGTEHDPPGWTQCDSIPGAQVPGITVPPGGTVTYGPTNITSTPEVAYDPAAADSNTYVRYGTETWNTLTANADIKLHGGTVVNNIYPDGTASTCNYANTFNWGEPLRPGSVAGCYGYYPIIYFDSDVHINGNGRGQGILLVNGSLDFNGIFDFYGLIIVRNDFNKGTGTADIHGAVFAANLALDNPLSWMTGDQSVMYSSCAVQSALQGSAILVRVKERGWTQIF